MRNNSPDVSGGMEYGFNYSYVSESEHYFEKIEHVLVSDVIGKICVLGIVGNTLNLIVLTRKSLTTNMERMERCAHVGLLALAVSDLLFCLSAYPSCWASKEKWQEFQTVNFWLIYHVYGSVFINIFLLSSTWLTVAMAMSRYVAIVFPLHARQHLGKTSTRIAISVIFLFSIVFNIPRFFINRVAETSHPNKGTIYGRFFGPLTLMETALNVYNWIYFLLCIFIPLLVLAFCNFFLVRTLRQSSRLRQQQGHHRGTDNKTILTLTLSIIVLLYLVLVMPAESLTFVKDMIISQQQQHVTLNLIITICNTLQAVNFSFNFLLYCIINANFRRTIHDIVCCVSLRKGSQPNSGGGGRYTRANTQTSMI